MATTDVKKQMFIANALSAIARQDSWEYLIPLKTALDINRQVPLDPTAWYRTMASMQLARQDGTARPSGPSAQGLYYFDKLLDWTDSENPLFLPLTKEARDYVRNLGGIETARRTEAGDAAFQRGSIYEKYSPQAAQILGEFYEVAEGDGAARDYWNELMARDLGSTKATPEQIVAQNPSLSDVLDSIRGKASDAEARASLEQQIKDLSTKLSETELKLHSAGTAGGGASQPLMELLAQEQEAREQRNKEIRQQTVVAGLRGALAVYSFLGGDATTVRRLSAILKAYQDARAAVQAYQLAIAANASQGMATMALAGGWVGVALALAAAFMEGDGEASFQSQIQEALSQLSKQLQQLQRQMSKGFQYVDERLVDLSRQMEAGFGAVVMGLQSNEYQLNKLVIATYSLSQRLSASTDRILASVDYAADAQVYDNLTKLANWKRNSGEYLSSSKLPDIKGDIDVAAKRSKDEFHSGAALANLNQAFRDFLQVTSVDELARWPKHINTYRSICQLLGVPLRSGRATNPLHWHFAAAACVDIGANNFDPPSTMEPLLGRLIDDGEFLVGEIQALRAIDGGTTNAVDLVFAFLLDCYVESMNSVAAAVLSIHKEKLELSRAQQTGALGEWDGNLSEARDASELSPQFKVTAARKADAFVPQASAPGGADVFPQWQQHPGLVACVPSTAYPDSWPAIESGQVWQAVPLEVRQYAVLAGLLGLGNISLEYQAQIEEMDWNMMNVLVGSPKVYYALVLTGRDNNRRALYMLCQNIADSHTGRSIGCYATNPLPYIQASMVNLKESLVKSQTGFSMLLLVGPNASKSVSFESLSDEVRRAYDAIAIQIRAEIAQQLPVADSALGSAVATLSKVVSLIRGMASWVLPDLLDSNADLRTCLFGSTVSWKPRFPGFSVERFSKMEPDVRIPLLDLRGLQELLTVEDEESPSSWLALNLLEDLARVAKASRTDFSYALREARAIGARAGYMSPEEEKLALLKGFRRYFGAEVS
jgi:hypothetical protein